MTESTPTSLSAKEKKVVLGRIHALMTYWDISPDELQDSTPAAPPPAAPTIACIKYRHPLSGETWNGVGPQPDWLRRALLSEGYTVQALRIAADAPTG